ncbi:MAG: hypothetical protein ABFE01_29215, partial [Phycisphaerales bacterium]
SEDGRIMSNEEAVQQYLRTGRHLGKFNSVKAANRYAVQIHKEQERLVRIRDGAGTGDPKAGGKTPGERAP